MRYTDSQIEAIEHREGNLLIIACAGSGKTEVISRKIAELIHEGVDRESIVAFTFTERAAKELNTRIRKHLENLLPNDPSLGDMYVGTIHSFCLRLLKELIHQYRNFDVVDREQQVAFIVSNFYDLRLHVLKDNHGLRHFETINRFINTLTRVHIEDIDINDITDPDIRTCLENYFRDIRGTPNNFLDFDCIINEMITLLRSNDEIRSNVQEQFRYVIVDEYQDIDPRQEELIRLLTGGDANLCVVGDDDQAIYGWRGAEIENILTFEERYEEVASVDMVDNFRSTHAVVEVANRAVRQLTTRRDKSMQAVHWEDDAISETLAERGDIHRLVFDSPENEARYIADRIEQLRGVGFNEEDGIRGLDWGDMAVLYRSVRNYAAPVVDELRRRGIPCIVKGARGLFAHDEVLLIQAALHLLADRPLYDYDLDQTLEEEDLRERIRDIISRLSRTTIPGSNANRFFEWIAEKRRHLELANLPPNERPRHISRRIYFQDIYHEMLEALGASQHVWADSVLFNLGRLSNLLTKYEGVHQWLNPRDLGPLLMFLDGWASQWVEEGGIEETHTINAVQILTVHSAKGLEWPVVFIPSVFSYHFPSSRRNRPSQTFIDDMINSQRYASGDDGERRLWYVALTRSKKFLEITSVRAPRRKPTVYVTEINHNYVLDENEDPIGRTMLEPSISVNAEIIPTNFSDLNYYWHCPSDYKLRRLMGFGPRIGQEFGYGQQIHNLLTLVHEEASRGNMTTIEDLDSLVEQNFTLRYTRGDPFENMRRAAANTLGNYIQEMGENLPEIVFMAEKPFEFLLGDALVSGKIDLLERVDETTGEREAVGVVDFKTGIDSDKERHRERLEDAEKQVILYTIAAREALRLNPRWAVVHFLDTQSQERTEVNINQDRREEIRNLIAQTIENIKGSVFPRNPRGGSHRCLKCDFKRICPGSCE